VLIVFVVVFTFAFLGAQDQHPFVLVPPWMMGLIAGIFSSIAIGILVAVLWTSPEIRERRIQEMLNRK